MKYIFILIVSLLTMASNIFAAQLKDTAIIGVLNLGNATDTTVARVSAGVVSVEGNTIYAAGGTDVAVVDGGTGSSTAAGALINLGLTATAAELNYVDGVTSAIQTQIDGKQGTLTNSAGLAAALSDETGTGLAVFGTTPTFTTKITSPEIENSGNITIDAINAVAASTLTVTNSDVTQVANLSVEGTVTGSNLSGTNTGDQTITLTGDVTGTGTGSFAATIAANSVALTTDTTGNYAAGDAEAGAALTGDSATSFFSSGTLEFGIGGTGLSSWTQYLIPYAATTTSIGQIAIGTSGQLLTSNGAGAAPTFQTAGGMQYTDTRFKTAAYFDYDTSTASGDLAITGIGFAPKGIIISGGVDSTIQASYSGSSDGTTNTCLFKYSGTGNGQNTVQCIDLEQDTAGGITTLGRILTLGADGYTITFTKNGAKTGTARFLATCWR